MSDPGWSPTLWESVLDEVLSGLFHELNGRLSGLSGVFHLLVADGAVDDEQRTLMAAELDGLEHAVTLLRQVPRRPAGAVESVRLAARLESLAELAGHRRRQKDVAIQIHEGERPPVAAVDWDGTSRCLLALLITCCRLAETRPEGRVEIHCDRGADGVGVRLTVPAGGAGHGASGREGPVAVDVEALRSLAAAAGADLEVDMGAPDAVAEASFVLRWDADASASGGSEAVG